MQGNSSFSLKGELAFCPLLCLQAMPCLSLCPLSGSFLPHALEARVPT